MDGFAELPFDSVKACGRGREPDRHGREEFLEVKTVIMRISRTRAPWVDTRMHARTAKQ
jgi:betaine-aldehyde dehydrogenase